MRLGNIINVTTICITAFTLSIAVANADPLNIAPIKIDPAFDLSKAKTADPLNIAPIKIDPAFDLSKAKKAAPLSTVCVDEKLASNIAAEQLDDGWVDVVSEWADEVSGQVGEVSEQVNLSPVWVDIDPAWVDVNPASSISEDTSPFNTAWVDVGPASSDSAADVGPSNTACVDVKHSIAAGVSESDILENLVSSSYDMDLDEAVESILEAKGDQQNTLIAALIIKPEYEFTPPFDPTAGFEPTAAGGPVKLPATPVKIAANNVSDGRGVGVSP